MPNVIGRLVAIIDADLSGLEKGLGDAQRVLGRAGRDMFNAGQALTAGLTVPIVGIGAVAIKASMDFQSAFTGVEQKVSGTSAQIAQLRKDAISLSKVMPQSASSIAELMQTAGQLGISTDAITGFTKVVIEMGQTTNLSADEAATAMAKLANIMQMPQGDFERLGSTILALGNAGASTEADIVDMAMRIAGAGKVVGLSTQEVLGFANALATVGIEAESGGTAISRAFVTMADAVFSGGDALDAFAQVAGMSSQAFADFFRASPAAAMNTFIHGLDGITKSGGNVFATLDSIGLGEIRVRDALLRLSGSGDTVTQMLAVANKGWAENSELTRETALRNETAAAKLAILKNRLQDAAIVLGDALVPALIEALAAAQPLIDGIVAMAEGFAKLPKPVQTAIVVMAGLTAALGPLLMMFGSMASGASSIMKLVQTAKLLGPAFSALGPMLQGLGAALLTPPVGLVVALVAAGIAIYIFRDQIRDGLKAAWGFIKGFADDVFGFLKGNWREVAGLLLLPFTGPLGLLATDAFGIRSKLLKALGDLPQKAGEKATAIASAISDAFTGGTSAAGGFFAGLGSSIASGFSSASSAVAGAVTGLIDTIAANFTAENMGRAVAWFFLWPLYLFRTAFDAVLPYLTTFFTSTLPTFFTSTIPSLASSALGIGSAVVSGIWNGLQTGWLAVTTFFTQTIPNAITTAVPVVAQGALSLGKGIVDGIVSGTTAAFGAVTTFFTSTLPGAISGAASTVASAASSLGGTIVNGIGSGITAALNVIEQAPGWIWNAFKGGFNAVAGEFLSIGKAIVNGVWDGIQSLRGWFQSQVEDFFGGIVKGVKGALGIHSPSTVFMAIGQNVVEGLQLGLNGMKNIDLFGSLKAAGSQTLAGVLDKMYDLSRYNVPEINGQMDPAALQQILDTGGQAYRRTDGSYANPNSFRPAQSGLTLQTYGPINVNNYDRKQDANSVRDLGFLIQTELAARGVRLA